MIKQKKAAWVHKEKTVRKFGNNFFFFFKTFIKEKSIKKLTTFLFLRVVKITAICNNAFRPLQKRRPHTAIHFSWIVFVKNKTKRIKRKIYKPVAPNFRPCRMLGAASFFHLRLLPSQYSLFFLWHGQKTEKIPRFGGAKST